ncbi:MAG TPA: glycosyltransferase [Bryobacteraceae bacterium]|nr:glycosyltransferase [Bryobacteraceae bacterium]
MPDALFLSAEAPYPLTGGGALRSASLLHFLACHYTLDAIVFREPRAPDPRLSLPSGLVRDLHILNLPEHSRSTLARAARNAWRLARRVPPLVDRFAGFGEQIAAVTRGRRYDLAVIEHFWCAPYGDQLARISAVTVLDLHNIESVLHERCARTEPPAQAVLHRAFQHICRDLEERYLPQFSYLLTASAVDAEHARRIAPGAHVGVYPNLIPMTPQPDASAEEVIAFSGNLEYHPNRSAVRYFQQSIWPALRERWPRLTWRIIGKNPDSVRKFTAHDPRIQLTGPVGDAVAELARAKVAIVPILAGSGTRVKILEAWAAGVPVVSTPAGAEGLPVRDGEHLLLADTAAGFADAVSRLLGDADLRQRIGRAARYLFECEFSWDAARKYLLFLYPATMERSDALRD